VTIPPQTQTVTASSTVTQTHTVTTAATTTSAGHPGTAVAVGVAAGNEEKTESGGLPGWVWALIGAVAAGLIIWGVAAVRARRRHNSAEEPPAEGSDS
jgi:hypothetical protein